LAGLKLTKINRISIHPFTVEERANLMEFIPAWYRPYFDLAVLTGVRPSEQVALKCSAVDDQFIHIELKRVRNPEKTELKTAASNRRIDIRSPMQEVLEEQKARTASFQSPQVFVDTQGSPGNQVTLSEVWVRAMKKSCLSFRRL
jgi:integrase